MKSIEKFEEDAQKGLEKTLDETPNTFFKAMRRVAPGFFLKKLEN